MNKEELINYIRVNDTGDGTKVEDIEKHFEEKHFEDEEHTSKMIMVLLSCGDVYEIKPGKLKVLE